MSRYNSVLWWVLCYVSCSGVVDRWGMMGESSCVANVFHAQSASICSCAVQEEGADSSSPSPGSQKGCRLGSRSAVETLVLTPRKPEGMKCAPTNCSSPSTMCAVALSSKQRSGLALPEEMALCATEMRQSCLFPFHQPNCCKRWRARSASCSAVISIPVAVPRTHFQNSCSWQRQTLVSA
jgi:hypothetical protein